MIIVTGTKRSGTSMWMQVLKAAGYTVLGDAFPRDWERTLHEANRAGFYESTLRDGIYFATNPNPKTGEYLDHRATKRVAAKVFIPGLIRSDVAFIDKVIATVRNWREYGTSVARLYALEQQSKRTLSGATGDDAELFPLENVPPALEWWDENYRLICDVLTRRYPLHMVSYGSVLASPERTIRDALAWLGGDGHVDRATAQVQENLRTQHAGASSHPDRLPCDTDTIFDELYARVHEQAPLDLKFVEQLNATQELLEPRIRAAKARAQASRRQYRALRKKNPQLRCGATIGRERLAQDEPR